MNKYIIIINLIVLSIFYVSLLYIICIQKANNSYTIYIYSIFSLFIEICQNNHILIFLKLLIHSMLIHYIFNILIDNNIIKCNVM